MYIKKKLLTVIAIIFATTSYANEILKIDTNKNYKVNVFSTDQVLPQFQTNSSDLPKFGIKIDPLLIISGDIPIFFETKFSKQMSVELGLGFTSSMFNLMNIEMIENAPADVQAPLGYSIRVAPRFYLPNYDEAINGYYVSTQFMLRKYNSLYALDNNPLSQNLDLVKQQTDFKLIFGFQNIEDYAFLVDYYVGLGIRKTSNDVVETDNNGNATVRNFNTMLPTITVGLKIGVAF